MVIKIFQLTLKAYLSSSTF